MSYQDDALSVLRSIDATLKRAFPAPAQPARLDGPHGDPVVKFDPRDWSGDSCKGRHFSECPPLYLDLLATSFDYFAGKPDAKDGGKWDRLSAGRARGWAARLRSGWTPETTTADEGGGPTW